MEILMKIIKSAKIFVREDYNAYTALAVRTLDGRWVIYGNNSEAAPSESRRVYRGRTRIAWRKLNESTELALYGGSRNISYNKWRFTRQSADTPACDFWYPRF